MTNIRSATREPVGASGSVARESLIWCIIVCHLVLMNGCMTTRQASVQGDEIPSSGNSKILRVILKNGSMITFNDDGGKLIEKTTAQGAYRAIVGVSEEGKVIEIDPRLAVDVKIESKSANVGGTILLVLGIASVVGAAVLIELLSHIH